MEYTPIWSGIIACYLFLGGLGGGAFATSAFLAWRHPEAVTMRKLGHWITPRRACTTRCASRCC